jgi:hypothetical protein
LTPRPGGEAAKISGSFEDLWTVRQMFAVLQGHADAIELEPDDPLGRGVEFALYRGDEVEVHQVKRQLGARNGWTIAALAREGVLEAARQQVEAGRRFRFISLIPCRPLHELAEQAARAGNADQLRGRLSAELDGEFARLTADTVWGSATAAHAVLRGLDIAWPDERELRSTNELFGSLLFDGAPGPAIVATLEGIARRKLGLRLTAEDLLAEMERAGMARSAGSPSRAVARLVEAATARWLDSAERAQLEPAITRRETQELVAGLDGPDRLFLASGDAGAGKSAVLAQVVRTIGERRGWPVLALRIDGAADARTSRDLGREAELDVSPVEALAAVAGDGPGLLVIDQVDAGSVVTGRATALVDAVAEVLREASAFPGLRVLLACRRFDLDNDDRLRGLRLAGDPAAEVAIGLLDDAQVDAAVSAMGLDARHLTGEQCRLLSLPLHLVLLNATATVPGALAFQAPKDLLDRFWRQKWRDCERQLGRPVRFGEVVARVALRMMETRRLAVAESVVDAEGLLRDAETLASQRVLRWSSGEIAFFHEAFFDYAFARQWAARNDDLVSYLAADEQALFHRAPLRQVLLHLHDADQARFGRELEALLVAPEIRFHLKHAAIGALAAIQRPSPEAWDAAQRILVAVPSLADHVRAALRSPGWLERLTSDGVLDQWLADPGQREQAIATLRVAVRVDPDRVAAVLRRAEPRDDYDVLLRTVTRLAELDRSRALFELVIEAVRRGRWHGDEAALWMAARDLGATQPVWAVELLAAHLVERPSSEAVAGGKLVALSSRDGRAVELTLAAAGRAPTEYWARLGPWLLSAMARTATDTTVRPVRDAHFTYRLWGERAHHLDDALLVGADRALRAIASPGAERPGGPDLRAALRPLVADVHDGAQWLLYRALTAAGAAQADWAAEILLEGPWRLRCGTTGNPHWTTRLLLDAIAPELADERLADLEAAILAYGDTVGLERGEHAVHTLLGALPPGRLSERGRRRQGELERRFGALSDPPPAVRVGTVASPVPDRARTLMTDAQWLGALAKHAGSVRGGDPFAGDPFVGGSEELAGLLQRQTAEEPDRFARLAIRPELGLDPAYHDAILHGLRETKALATPRLMFAVIEHIAVLGNPRHERWLADPLTPVRDDDIPDAVIALLVERALHAADPEPGAPPKIRVDGDDADADADADEDHPIVDLFTEGLNTARGGLAHGLAGILGRDPDGTRTAVVAEHLPALCADPSPAVRTCVAELVVASLRHAEARAVAAYPTLVDGQDAALATRPMEALLRFMAYRDLDTSVAVVERMLGSGHARVRRAAGRLAADFGLQHDVDGLLARVAGASDAQVRRGAAVVCAAWVPDDRRGDDADAVVRRLLRDPDKGVRKAAASVATHLRDRPLRGHANLLADLIAGPAFEEELGQLLLTLERAPDRVDDLVLAMGRRFVADYGSAIGDFSTSAAGDAREMSRLVLRAYAQAGDAGSRERALDLIDEFLLLGAYGVEDAVREAER